MRCSALAHIDKRCFFIFLLDCAVNYSSPLRKMLIDPKASHIIKLIMLTPLTNVGQPWLFFLTITAVVYESRKKRTYFLA